ncbi:NAD(P)H-dependent glycerol-3-phosphate dehydrogenase [Rhodophyticola sp. SM2404]
MSERIDIAGAGAFGTALAIAFGRAGHEVTLWARQAAGDINAARENKARLAGHALPDTVRATGDLADLKAEILLLAIPTQKLGSFLDTSRVDAPHLICCSKGIHRESGLGPTALIASQRPKAFVAQLTGPSFAADIAAGLPTALTLACANDAIGQKLQTTLSTSTLRLYRSTDVIGAELGGALKNVIAIAAGAVIGRGLGESARAALMARGFAEMRRISTTMGARDDTLAGLSGFGDLVLTCTSEKSRNMRFGMALARGESIDPSVTVEGLATAQELAARKELDTPIADAVAHLANGDITFDEALEALLTRPLKSE